MACVKCYFPKLHLSIENLRTVCRFCLNVLLINIRKFHMLSYNRGGTFGSNVRMISYKFLRALVNYFQRSVGLR